ncbi:MAG: hypothetical protein RH862_07060 [Leptospiraceae bacterium]
MIRFGCFCLLALFLGSCASAIYYPRVESSEGILLESPERSVRSLNVCTLGMTRHYEVVNLLQARGHTLIPLGADLEVQREQQQGLSCDVVLLLEKYGSVDTGTEEEDWRMGWVILSLISFSVIPYTETQIHRSTIQIINPQTRKSVRILADLERVTWNSSVAFPVLNYREQNGQYGRARLSLSLSIVSAAESMGQRGSLRLKPQSD